MVAIRLGSNEEKYYFLPKKYVFWLLENTYFLSLFPKCADSDAAENTLFNMEVPEQ